MLQETLKNVKIIITLNFTCREDMMRNCVARWNVTCQKKESASRDHALEPPKAPVAETGNGAAGDGVNPANMLHQLKVRRNTYLLFKSLFTPQQRVGFSTCLWVFLIVGRAWLVGSFELTLTMPSVTIVLPASFPPNKHIIQSPCFTSNNTHLLIPTTSNPSQLHLLCFIKYSYLKHATCINSYHILMCLPTTHCLVQLKFVSI